MISSLTNQGKLRFMNYEGALKAPIFLDFLRMKQRSANSADETAFGQFRVPMLVL